MSGTVKRAEMSQDPGLKARKQSWTPTAKCTIMAVFKKPFSAWIRCLQLEAKEKLGKKYGLGLESPVRAQAQLPIPQRASKLKNYRPVRALHVKLFFCSADTDLNFRVCCVSMSSSIFRVLCVRSETSQKLTRISTESIFPRNSSNEGSAKICSTSKSIRFQLF